MVSKNWLALLSGSSFSTTSGTCSTCPGPNRNTASTSKLPLMISKVLVSRSMVFSPRITNRHQAETSMHPRNKNSDSHRLQ